MRPGLGSELVLVPESSDSFSVIVPIHVPMQLGCSSSIPVHGSFRSALQGVPWKDKGLILKGWNIKA